MGSGGSIHKDPLLDPQLYLVDRGALLVLPPSLLRLDRFGPLGCTEAVFCPGPRVGVVGLHPELGPDLLPVIDSGCFLVCTRCLVHSLAFVEAIVLLVAVGKVAVLEVVVAKVGSTSVAVVIVATTLEVVNVKVAVLLIVVVKVARPQGG